MYNINPVEPEPLTQPNPDGMSGFFNDYGGVVANYLERKPEHDRHVAEHDRFVRVQAAVEASYEATGLGQEWTDMAPEQREALVKAHNAVSAISEEAAKAREGLRNILRDREDERVRQTLTKMGYNKQLMTLHLVR